MRRGDVVTVAVNGDYGKPRPALVLQTDALPRSHPSVLIVQFTTALVESDFRVTVEPTPENGLNARSQAMIDKLVAVRRDRIGAVIGRLMPDEMARITAAVVFLVGAAD